MTQKLYRERDEAQRALDAANREIALYEARMAQDAHLTPHLPYSVVCTYDYSSEGHRRGKWTD